MDARIGTLVRNGSTVFYVTLEGNYIEGDLAEVLFYLSVADRYEVRKTAAAEAERKRVALSTRPTDAELVKLLRLTHTPLTDQSLSCKGCGETWPCANVQAADALEAAQETAPPMTPERAVEVATLYARAEVAAATIRAVTRWRAALAGMTSADPDEALNAVWEAGEAYESISIEN